MPYRRKYGRKYTRKRKPFYMRYSGIRSVMPSGMQVGFPPSRRVRHRFSYVYGQTSLAAGVDIGVVNIRINDLYNTGGSFLGQPMGYDQLSAIYKNWKVRSAKTTVQAITKPGTAAADWPSNLIWGIQPTSSSGAAYATLQGYLESQKGQWAVAGLNASINLNSTSCRAYYSANKYFGLTDDDGLTGQIASSPAILAYHQIWWGPADGISAMAAKAEFVITVDYIVDWFETNQIAESV